MISILLPTRRRPQQLQKMVESARLTCVKEPEIVAYVDEDDIQSIAKVEELSVKYIVGPKQVFTNYWNKCYEICTGAILMMAVDDIIFCTEGWDELVEKKFSTCPDKILLVYGDTTGNDRAVPSHPLVHRRWAEIVGYFSPPYFECGSCDFWLNDIAKFLGRKQSVPFVLKQHPIIPECKQEEIERQVATNSRRNAATELYRSLALERLADAAKLQEAIDEEK